MSAELSIDDKEHIGALIHKLATMNIDEVIQVVGEAREESAVEEDNSMIRNTVFAIRTYVRNKLASEYPFIRDGHWDYDMIKLIEILHLIGAHEENALILSSFEPDVIARLRSHKKGPELLFLDKVIKKYTDSLPLHVIPFGQHDGGTLPTGYYKSKKTPKSKPKKSKSKSKPKKSKSKSKSNSKK